MSENNAIEVVSACVIRDGRVLLVKRAPGVSHPGKWVTPGGKVERGESHHAATVRELEEECGLNLCQDEIGAIVYAYDIPSTTRPGSRCQVTCRRVAYAPHMGEIRLKLDEVDGYGWFGPHELDALLEMNWLGPADAANVPALGAACLRLAADDRVTSPCNVHMPSYLGPKRCVRCLRYAHLMSYSARNDDEEREMQETAAWLRSLGAWIVTVRVTHDRNGRALRKPIRKQLSSGWLEVLDNPSPPRASAATIAE